jgi:ribosomal protein S18 acetylase RimI-like enzyme
MARIEKATLNDIPTLNELVNSAYRGDSSRAGWTTEADILDGIRTSESALSNLIQQGHTILLLKDLSDQLIGSVLLEFHERGVYLGMLTVKPTLQGAGLGKLLLQASESWAIEQGQGVVYMTVISVRSELIAWYERHGYQRTGETAPFPMDDPSFGLPKQVLEFIYLEKQLDNC